MNLNGEIMLKMNRQRYLIIFSLFTLFLQPPLAFSDQKTDLLSAVYQGDYKEVGNLLSEGVDLESLTAKGSTALIVAVA